MFETAFADPKFLEACHAQRSRRFGEAADGYRSILALRPHCALSMFNLSIAEAMGSENGTTLPSLASAVDMIGDDLEPYLSIPFVSFLRTPQMLRDLGQGLVDFGATAAGRRLLRAAVVCQSTSGLSFQQTAQAFQGSHWSEMAKDGVLDEAFDPASPVQPQSADDWYRIGALFFLKKQASKAYRAFREMAHYDHRVASIYGPSPLVGEASRELRGDQRDTITMLLERYAEADAAGRLPTPLHSRRLGGAPIGTVPFEQVTMLSVFTQWVGCTSKSLPGYLAEIFHGTASRLGIGSHFFAADPVIYNGGGSYNPKEMRDCLERLADAYAALKPDIFLFDASYRPSSDSINYDFLNRVIDRKRTKIVAVVGDAWWGHSAHWEAIADVVVTFDPLVTNDKLLLSPYPERMLPIFHPIDEERFYEQPLDAPIDDHALFVGSIVNTPSMMRMPWITALGEAKAPVVVHDGDRSAQKGLSHEAYAMVMRKAAMTYSFSSRNRNRSTIIGRQWEAIQSGTLLLEEGGSPLDEFFQPFRHYIPFDNVAEALAYTNYFLENRAARDAIATRAMKFRRQHYNTRRFWELVLQSTFGPTIDSLQKNTEQYADSQV